MKRQTKPNPGKNVEQPELPSTVGQSLKQYNHFRKKNLVVSYEIKYISTPWLNNIIPKKKENTCPQKDFDVGSWQVYSW